MKRGRWALAALVGTWLGCSSGYAEQPKPSTEPTGAAGSSVVVVELFTSEGCSSCPPADDVLRLLGADPALKGKVVPLSYHVDYWDYLGWGDPYASERWSNRQREYGAALQQRSIYTPELVIQGRAHVVGSHEGKVRQGIADASKLLPAGRATVKAKLDGDAIEVEAQAELLRAVEGGDLVAWVITFDSGHSSRVTRGENTGSTLKHDFVVRDLRRAFGLKPDKGASDAQKVRVPLAEGWHKDKLGVALLLQDRKTMQIHAAAVVHLADPSP